MKMSLHHISDSKGNPKGQITVFLSLSLTIVLSLILAVIASAKDRSMRMRTEMAMDMGMQSVFSEYNRALLSEYDLYFIDTTYGGSGGSVYNTGEHLKEYMEYNLNPSKGQVLSLSRDLFALSPKDVSIKMFSLATDSNAAVYKRQAIHAVKDRYGLSLLEKMKGASDDYQGSGIGGYDVERERQNNARRLKDAGNKTDAEGNPLPYDNPADKIEAQRTGMLGFILSSMDLSGRSVSKQTLASVRQIAGGDGIVCNDQNLNSVTNNLLFQCYLTDRFGSYTNKIHEEGLSYELEYILNGQPSDEQNLRSIVNRLLIMREAANAIFLFKSEEKRAVPKMIAASIAALLLCPELEEPIEYSILFAWAFAEACVDVRTLLKGGKVPLMKSNETWVLSLAQAMAVKAHLDDGLAKGAGGFDYTQYLYIFLTLQNSDQKVWRSLDMIEQNLRTMKGNSGFCIDKCLEYMEAEVKVTSGYGAEYSVCRYFGYEKMPQME